MSMYVSVLPERMPRGYADAVFAIRTFSHRRFCASAIRLRASGVKFLFNGPEMGV